MNLGPVETGSGNGGADLLLQTYTDAGGLLNSNALVVKRSSGYVGVGKSTPVYALDVSAGPGLASVNMTSWARFPVSNMLMAIAENTQLGGFNGGAYNFSNPIQTMDSNLITFTNSNASVGASFVIKKTGIWNINFLFATGNGQYVFIDVSTGNIASNSYGSNNSLPIAFGGQGSGGVASVSYTGYLPSNDTYIYKFRGGSNLSAVGYSKNILQITFLGETPNSGAAFPF